LTLNKTTMLLRKKSIMFPAGNLSQNAFSGF